MYKEVFQYTAENNRFLIGQKGINTMKLQPIVVSLLDTDLYKFNMDQVIFHKHTDLCGQYFFKCRNKDVVFTAEMVQEM